MTNKAGIKAIDALIFGVILLGVAALATRLWVDRRGSTSVPPALEPGSQLPAAMTRVEATGKREALSSRVLESAHRCQVLIFFASTCPACHKIAPSWAGMTEVKIGSGEASVQWVAGNPADTGATSFLASFELGAGVHLASPKDRLTLGLIAWPTAYLVTRTGTFLQELPLFPQQLDSLDVPACQES